MGEIESLAAKPSSHRAVYASDQCVGQELNLHSRRRVGYGHRGLPMPNRRVLFSASSTDGSRTHKRSRRFELRRFTGLRTVLSQRPRRDLNPGTDRRLVLHRDRVASTPDCSTRACVFPVAQVGLEPTASLVLSQGGLPIAYRAVSFASAQSRTRTCTRAGLSRAALPVGVSGPRWSRMDSNHRFPGCGPGVFAARPRDHSGQLSLVSCHW